jgi:hypothetical protein
MSKFAEKIHTLLLGIWDKRESNSRNHQVLKTQRKSAWNVTLMLLLSENTLRVRLLKTKKMKTRMTLCSIKDYLPCYLMKTLRN